MIRRVRSSRTTFWTGSLLFADLASAPRLSLFMSVRAAAFMRSHLHRAPAATTTENSLPDAASGTLIQPVPQIAVPFIRSSSPTCIIPFSLFGSPFASKTPMILCRCRAILCFWTSAASQMITMVGVAKEGSPSEYPVLRVPVDELESAYLKWLNEALPGTSHTVWFVPNFPSKNGIAVQNLMRTEMNKRQIRQAEVVAAKRRNVDADIRQRVSSLAPGDELCLLPPEVDRAIVSLHQLRKEADLSETQWPLSTPEDCLKMLRQLDKVWSSKKWQSVLEMPQTAMASVRRQIGRESSNAAAGSAVARVKSASPASAQATRPAEAVPATSSPSVTAATVTKPSLQQSSSTRSPATSQTSSNASMATCFSRLIIGASSSVDGRCHVQLAVAATTGAAKALHLIDPFSGKVLDVEAWEASLSSAMQQPEHIHTVPVYFVTTPESFLALSKRGMLMTRSTTLASGEVHTYRPYVIAAHELERTVHRAATGRFPKQIMTSEEDAAAVRYAQFAATTHEVERVFVMRAVGPRRLLEFAMKHVTDEEWRSLLRRGSDITPLKQMDTKIKNNKTDNPAKEENDATPHWESGHRPPMVRDQRLCTIRDHNQQAPMASSSSLMAKPKVGLLTLDNHMASIFSSPRRATLEAATFRQLLFGNLCDVEAGRNQILALSVTTDGKRGRGRDDNPFLLSNAVRHVESAWAHFVSPSTSTSTPAWLSQPGLQATIQRRGTGTIKNVSVARERWIRGESIVPHFSSQSPPRLVVAVDAKRCLLHLRHDPLYRSLWKSTQTEASPPRIWCVLYAQYILSGFREKYTTLRQVAALYPPLRATKTPPGVQPPTSNDLDLLLHIFHHQVSVAAAGRALISLTHRMEGLLASAAMEVNGIALAPPSAVDAALDALQANSRRIDTLLAEYLGTVLAGTPRGHFNWRAPADVAVVLFGGGLIRLLGKRNTTHMPATSAVPGSYDAPRRPLLHRYLLECFGSNGGSAVNAHHSGGVVDTPPEFSDELANDSKATSFVQQRTSFVVVSLNSRGDGIIHTVSVFVPWYARSGGGVHFFARIITDEPRSIAAAGRQAAGGSGSASDTEHCPALCRTENAKVQPIMSLQEFLDSIANNGTLKEMRNEMAVAGLDVADTKHSDKKSGDLGENSDDKQKTLMGSPASRLAALPPNVVFIVEREDPNRTAGHAIYAGVIQTVCRALEIQAQERVAFVSSTAIPPLVTKQHIVENTAASTQIPNFALDFENMEKVMTLRDAQRTWMEDVLGNVSTSAVPPIDKRTFAQFKLSLLRALHARMLKLWSSSRCAPFLDVPRLPLVPPNWLSNQSAIIHPQLSLYCEGYVWRMIRSCADEPKRTELAAATVKIVQDFSSTEIQGSTGGVGSVNGPVLDNLISLWEAHGLDASILRAISEKRSSEKVIQLFQPDKLLRCCVSHEATAQQFIVSEEEAIGQTHSSARETFFAVRGEILHWSTNTGRLSSQNPCVHNLPKEGTVRSLFCSRFGEKDGVMIEVDYAQLEVVVLALLSGDVQMIAELNDKIDFHCLRVSLMKREPYDSVVRKVKIDKDEAYIALRQRAKVFSFQRAYGAGVQSIASTSKLSIQEVEALIAAEEQHYPHLSNYYRLVRQSIIAGAEALARKHRMQDLVEGVVAPSVKLTAQQHREREECFRQVRNIEPSRYFPIFTGSKFDFPDVNSTPMQKNHPVQGFAGEIVQMICGKLARHLATKPSFVNREGRPLVYLVNSVHDCVWLDCHASVACEVEQDAKAIMESVSPTLVEVLWHGGQGAVLSEPPPWPADVPFPVSVHRGKNLGAWN